LLFTSLGLFLGFILPQPGGIFLYLYY